MADPRAAIRREQLHMLLASVPILIVAYFVVGLIGSFSERPLAVVLLLLPLFLCAAILGYPLVRDRRLLLGGGFLPFFVAYCLLFAVAAGTRVLEGRRATLAGFEADAPSNVLGLSRLGDWHYALARPAPPMNDVVIVTLPSFEGDTLELARRTQADLIARAVRHQARGIAFDYTLIRGSQTDRTLCFWIERAEAAGVPVVYGYRVEYRDSLPVRLRLPPELEGCIAQERLGTLTGLLESDGRVRMVPTSHLADTTLRSFSWRIASLLAHGDGGLPRVGLVQYVAPASPPPVLEGVPDATAAERFRDRFVIVGSHREGDVRATTVRLDAGRDHSRVRRARPAHRPHHPADRSALAAARHLRAVLGADAASGERRWGAAAAAGRGNLFRGHPGFRGARDSCRSALGRCQLSAARRGGHDGRAVGRRAAAARACRGARDARAA